MTRRDFPKPCPRCERTKVVPHGQWAQQAGKSGLAAWSPTTAALAMGPIIALWGVILLLAGVLFSPLAFIAAAIIGVGGLWFVAGLALVIGIKVVGAAPVGCLGCGRTSIARTSRSGDRGEERAAGRRGRPA